LAIGPGIWAPQNPLQHRFPPDDFHPNSFPFLFNPLFGRRVEAGLLVFWTLWRGQALCFLPGQFGFFFFELFRFLI